MRISERLQKLKPSATLAVNAKAMALRAQGREIVSLAVGEPDFPTPPHVCEAAKRAIDEGFTHYTPVAGIPELRAAAAAYYGRFSGVEAGAENVAISAGGKQAIFNLLMAVINPGDEVLIPAPHWVSYPPMVELAGGVPVSVPTKPENGFMTNPRELEAMSSPRTAALIINTPGNPTGCHYPQEALDEIVHWARSRDIFIISDEVYDRLVYEPAKPSTLARQWLKHPESVALVGSLSKSFAMTGWRVGWALAHPDLIRACIKIQGQTTSNATSIAQKAGLAALTGPWDVVEKMRTAFARRRDLALSIIATWPGVTCPRPDGAFYLFPVVESCYTEETPDSAALCARLLDEAGVALVPGSAFGDDRCVRFSYAVADDVLTAALKKVGRVLAKKK